MIHVLSDNKNRMANSKDLIEIFDRVFATRTRDEWLDIFRSAGLMFCPVQTIQEAFKDPQAIENDYIVEFDHPSLGKVKIPGYPIRFGSTVAGTREFAPTLGEHTDIIMKQLGFTDREIKELADEGVVLIKPS